MQIVRSLGGYSLGRADLVRRAMSKKKMDVMEKERRNFIYGSKEENVPGALSRGVDEKAAGEIFDEMIDFAKYAFNKSHATVYALVAYQTAYLKYFYPTEFMAAMLTSEQGNADKVSLYINYCSLCGIKLLPPDVNESGDVFSVEDGGIRFSLSAVKNVGRGVVKSIVSERKENGKFKSLNDFCVRMRAADVNKRTLEGLIKCGAFDFLGANRMQLLAIFEAALSGASKDIKNNLEGQMDLFGESEEGGKADSFPDIPDCPQKMRLAMEKESAGIYLTGHPLSEYSEAVKRLSAVELGVIRECAQSFANGEYSGISVADGASVTVCGILEEKKEKLTKSGQMMAFLTLEDMTGSLRIIVFPKLFGEYAELMCEDKALSVTGRINYRDDGTAELVAEKISELSSKTEAEAVLSVDDLALLDKIRPIVLRHPGMRRLVIKHGEKLTETVLSVDLNEELRAEISLLGAEINEKA